VFGVIIVKSSGKVKQIKSQKMRFQLRGHHFHYIRKIVQELEERKIFGLIEPFQIGLFG
jgi:hypothetical protein